MPAKLTERTRALKIPALIEQGWEMADVRDAITKEFKFKSFAQAFGWMSSVAILAEKNGPPSRMVERL